MFSLPGLYVIVRFLLPLPWSAWLKVVMAVLVMLGSQFHLVSRLSSGSQFAPEMPWGVIVAFNWAFGAVLILAVLQVLVDAGALLASLAQARWHGIPVWLRHATGVASLVLAAYGISQALKVPVLKDLTIELTDLPPQFDGYRLLQMTDLHISRLFDARWARATVQAAGQIDADLIVITGDLIDGSLAARRADVAALADLRAPDGVFVIPGNHEYYFGYQQWMAHYAALGMQRLENSHVVLQRDGAQLILAGVTDLSARNAGQPPPDLDAALRGAPDRAPVILLDHQPTNARLAAAKGVALQLSGHTHGGMFAGLNRVVARANGGYVAGRYDVDGMSLYVSDGTGLWPGFALRIGTTNELTRITLVRRKA